jgi:glutamine amidotransferase
MIGIIDYGAGNTASVSYALEKFGVPFIVTNERSILESADKVIFPGVGAAEAAMERLKKLELDTFLKNTKKTVLGICLGMQMLSSFSEEGNIPCLGIVAEKCLRFPEGGEKVPHMGWSRVHFPEEHPLFSGIANDLYFYFAHSYYIPAGPEAIAVSENGVPFAAALHSNNFYGMQFHPEKSSAAGHRVLKNFIELL